MIKNDDDDNSNTDNNNNFISKYMANKHYIT